MLLREFEEGISYTFTDIQEETDEIYRVVREMTKIEYLGGDAFISGIKSMAPCEVEEKLSYTYRNNLRRNGRNITCSQRDEKN